MHDIDKVRRVRSYCFREGVLKHNDTAGFRLAFRTLNSIYVRMRDGKPFPEAKKSPKLASKTPKSQNRV